MTDLNQITATNDVCRGVKINDPLVNTLHRDMRRITLHDTHHFVVNVSILSWIAFKCNKPWNKLLGVLYSHTHFYAKSLCLITRRYNGRVFRSAIYNSHWSISKHWSCLLLNSCKTRVKINMHHKWSFGVIRINHSDQPRESGA